LGHEIDRDGQDAEARLLRAVLANASDAILVTEAWPVDEPGPRIVYANETFVRMTGYTLEDVMGKTPRILQSPDTERWKLDGIRTALESWKPVRVELLNLRKGGEEFWVEISIVPVAVDGGDRYTHWVSIQREVTARKRAEAETRREEERFRAALDRNASDVVFILEGDGAVRYGSPSLRGVLGYRPEDLVDTSFLDHVHPDDAVAVERLLEEAVAGTGVTTPTGFRFAHADGTWRYLEAVGNGLLEDPSMEGIVINAWDTTGRKRAEDDAYLKDRAVAASSNGVITTDPNLPDNPIVYVNPKFEEITGYEAAEAIGLNCRFLANLEREQPTTGELRIAIAEGREWSGALRNYRKDGEVFWNELYIAPVRDGGGRLTNFIGIQKDITEQKLLEETLAHQAYYDLSESYWNGKTSQESRRGLRLLHPRLPLLRMVENQRIRTRFYQFFDAEGYFFQGNYPLTARTFSCSM
jgi:PAS domain S-box-containing protein